MYVDLEGSGPVFVQLLFISLCRFRDAELPLALLLHVWARCPSSLVVFFVIAARDCDCRRRNRCEAQRRRRYRRRRRRGRRGYRQVAPIASGRSIQGELRSALLMSLIECGNGHL